MLQDIETAIEYILKYTEGFTLATYKSDSKTKHAVERNFEIIGEAAARLTEKIKKAYRSSGMENFKGFQEYNHP